MRAAVAHRVARRLSLADGHRAAVVAGPLDTPSETGATWAIGIASALAAAATSGAASRQPKKFGVWKITAAASVAASRSRCGPVTPPSCGTSTTSRLKPRRVRLHDLPQVRQVVKTYAPGFAWRWSRCRTRAASPGRSDSATPHRRCRGVFSAESLPLLEAAPELAAAANDAGRWRSRPSTRSRSACSRPRATYGCCNGDRRGSIGGQPDVLRRPALRVPRSSLGVHPPIARTHRRRDGRLCGGARLRADVADARAAHLGAKRRRRTSPPTRRCSRSAASCTWPARSGGAARAGGDVYGSRRLREGTTRRGRARAAVSGAADVQGICRAHRAERPRGPGRCAGEGIYAGYPLGRDYPGLDDALLVAVTEKRTVEEIDRLVEALAS